MKKLANKNKVIVIIGPTASGKSDVAIQLAKRINGEIISADSMQIYKGLDIGTAKVTKEEMQNIPHYMLNICDINSSYSVAEYKNACYKYIDIILKKGNTPIIVGGTGLYINAVVNNMCFEKEEEIDIKKYEKYSNEKLIEILEKLDSKALDNIDVNNRKRIIRAIVMAKNGNLRSNKEEKNDLWQAGKSKYNFFVVYIDMPRDILYDKIEKRIDGMNKDDLISEAKKVLEYKDSNTGPLQAIGYKELFPYIENKKILEECLIDLKQNSRHYAKRQITWFKKLKKDLIILGTKNKEMQVEEILSKYND